MYSRQKIQRNLLRASKQIRQQRNLPSGWQLRPSDSEEIEEMKEYLDTLVRSSRGKQRMLRDLTPEEELWILNETTLCKIDFSYFCRNYVRIVDENSKVVPFNMRLPQQIIFEEMGRAEEQGTAIMFLYLKARQLGITTYFQAALAHRTFLYRNITAITGSSAEGKSLKMVGKLEFIYDQLPWWMRPEMTNYRKGHLLQFDDLNSGLYVQWGNQKSDIGRGDTPTIAHLSEVATYENPESLIDAGLIRALHENPFALVALESTAEGIGNWFHKTWQTQSTLAAKGIARVDGGDLVSTNLINIPRHRGLGVGAEDVNLFVGEDGGVGVLEGLVRSGGHLLKEEANLIHHSRLLIAEVVEPLLLDRELPVCPEMAGQELC